MVMDPAMEPLRLVCVADFGQHVGDECEQLVEGMKSRCLARHNVLNPALESLRLGLRPELNNESRFVLPSFHEEWRILLHRVERHNPAVKLL